MTTKALVVDDDPDILDVVSDILESLGHECDRADSVESARQCLDRDEYTYVLLDLEIPVRAGRSFARVQNGENLLEEMIQRRESRKTPVIIVMTAHGTDGHELAVDVMKKGAVDYVAKPFKTVGRTLDKSIREALSRVGDSPVHQLATAVLPKIGKAEQTIQPKVFSGGEMVFYADHVELCGVIICGGPRCEPARKALALLRQKSTKGDFVALGSRKLAEMIGRDGGPNSVPGLIQGLRKRMIQELRAIGIQCGLRDVIVRTNHGYQLNAWITVQEGNEGTGPENQGHDAPNAGQNVPNHADPDVPNDPNDPNPDDPNVPDGDAEARRNWIIQELGQGRKLRAPDIERELHCSLKTSKRDLKFLKDERRIEFVGTRRTGHYRLKQSTKPR